MPKPKKSPEEKRDRPIKLAFNESEYNLIVSRAQASGKPLAVYSREVILRKAPKTLPPINQQVWAEMGKHYSHIAQIAKTLSEAKLQGIAIPPSLFTQLTEELHTVKELRPKLLGK